MFICEDCEKPITTKEFWFRHHFDKIEYYCEKCGRSHIDFRGGICDFGLMITTQEAENRRTKNE